MQLYNIPSGGKGLSPADFTDYTAEFLLTRGPYALLGYSWLTLTLTVTLTKTVTLT